jgi:DNA-binding CsgD family transcriptional regulator
MSRPAPHGALLGSELEWAIELLTDRQLRAYRYRREGHALNWIANRLGVKRPRVVHLIAAAEKRLGYELTVTPKQKSPYKPAARRREERESAWERYVNELFSAMPPADRRRLLRIFEESQSDEEVKRRLKSRLEKLERERSESRTRRVELHWDLVAPHRGEDALAAEMEASFGMNERTGEDMRPQDLIEDDGKGYDRL